MTWTREDSAGTSRGVTERHDVHALGDCGGDLVVLGIRIG